MIRKLTSASLALLALLTLAACDVGTPPDPTPGITVTTVPTDEPTEAPLDQPTARFGDGCAELVPTSVLSSIFPFPVQLNDFLATEYSAGNAQIPRHSSVAQLGGMLCEWSNGQPYSSQSGASAFRGIQIAILPEASEGWAQMVSYYGFDGETGQVYCADGDSGVCVVDVYQDGYWVSAEIVVDVISGTLAAVESLATHLRSQASMFGTPAPRWEGADVLAVPSDCDLTLPSGLVDEIFGPVEMDLPDGGGGWSLYAAAYASAGNGWGCGSFDESSRAVWVDWVNGGSWIATHLGALDGTPFTVPGMTDADSATLSCVGTRCVSQLIIGRSWIIASVEGSADPEAGATRLAEHLVDQIR
jgi:hypothetical protein